jgi:hypothetical protein
MMPGPDATDKLPATEFPASAEQALDRLVELTGTAQREHHAVGHALGNALQHAMAAGDALLAARELVPAGQWLAYLRKTDIGERSAQVYIRVAKRRADLEAQSSAGPLSIAAALEFLKEPAPAKAKPRPKIKRAKATATSFNALTWWSKASAEARQRFFDSIGLLALLAALPPEFRVEIERRAARHRATGASKLANTLTGALKTALSLQAGASANRPAAGVANALNAINNKLKSEGLDLHDVEIAVSTNAESRRCAA